MKRGDGDPARAEELRCASCEKAVAADATVECATCKRRICRGCARFYGHFMLVCDECRIESW